MHLLYNIRSCKRPGNWNYVPLLVRGSAARRAKAEWFCVGHVQKSVIVHRFGAVGFFSSLNPWKISTQNTANQIYFACLFAARNRSAKMRLAAKSPLKCWSLAVFWFVLFLLFGRLPIDLRYVL